MLISSVFIFTGCRQSPYLFLQNTTANIPCIESFRPDITSVLYNSHVNVVGKHLSGLLLFKKMEDSSTRVLFVNEMGVKFFDFEFAPSGFKVIYCIKQLNKNVVINELKKDIGLLIFYQINIKIAEYLQSDNELYFAFKTGTETNYYITDKQCKHLNKIENATAKKKKIVLTLTDYKSGMPDSVYIEHQNFEFNISLKQIER